MQTNADGQMTVIRLGAAVGLWYLAVTVVILHSMSWTRDTLNRQAQP